MAWHGTVYEYGGWEWVGRIMLPVSHSPLQDVNPILFPFSLIPPDQIGSDQICPAQNRPELQIFFYILRKRRKERKKKIKKKILPPSLPHRLNLN